MTNFRKKRNVIFRFAGVVLAPLVIALIVVLLVFRPAPVTHQRRTDEGPRVSPTTAADSPSEAPRAQGANSELVQELSELGQAQAGRGTADSLIEKGFPLMTNPRRYVYQHTARQSIPELVADLGYRPTIYLSSITSGMALGSGYYHFLVMGHVKVIRLIEEGRQQPDVVAPLLRSSLRASLDVYDEVRDAEKVEVKKLAHDERPPPGSGDKDPYYNQHHRYEDPILEFVRLEHVIYSDFYILLSIGRPASPKLVAEWVAKSKRPGWMRKDIDMNLWLISEAYEDPRFGGTPERKQFAAALAGWKELKRRAIMSRWNALVDLRNPLVLARNVDTSDVRTIEVPRIPRDEAPLRYEEKEAFVQQFISVVKRVCQ